MRTFRFYKEVGIRWYVDLPEWEGSKDDLEMIAGADLFLEILAQGEGEVHVTMTVDDFPGSSRLVLTELGRLEGWEMGEGAWYKVEEYFGLDLSLWLCDVTTFVFGDFPKTIYFCKSS
jgi:hypothetical protein